MMKEAWGDDWQWDPWDRAAGATNSKKWTAVVDWAETGGLAAVGWIGRRGRFLTSQFWLWLAAS